MDMDRLEARARFVASLPPDRREAHLAEVDREAEGLPADMLGRFRELVDRFVAQANASTQASILSKWVLAVARTPEHLHEEAFAKIEAILCAGRDRVSAEQVMAILRRNVAAAAVLTAHTGGARH